ncbi:enolase C-terminal domain-like protein [Streptomyces sp. 8L]|uniref:enolase C-terminal domain-like protein n=1 Tax=Streptomyces sp. 8L TaxID=2877242 RepID=UPI001CD744F7|nr:enolase C-terminal domain-like protein [Streptomyces sp. 8L]MCA1217428.1 mandelate racemase [Streptomyces sp. 8L]
MPTIPAGAGAGADGDRDAAGPAVDRLDVTVCTVPAESPAADATPAPPATTVVLVEAVAGDTAGLGWTYGDPAVGRVVTGALAPVVRGRGAYDVPAAHDAMNRAVRGLGRPGLVTAAISAVDIALWDLKARLIGLPLTALLGAVNREVAVYASGGYVPYGQARLERQLRGWTEDLGIPRVKIKIGEDRGRAPQRDLDRVHVAREILGPVPELYVDADGGYSVKQAVRIAELCADDGVSWFEEPVPAEHPERLRQVRDAVMAEVAAGEYGGEPAYFARLAQTGAVDCLQADVTRCGGITGWLRAAAVAESCGLEISGHGAPHAQAHVAAAVPNLRHLEWSHDHVRVESALFDGLLDPAGGTVEPGASGAPGLGLAVRREEVRRYRVA